MPHTSGHEPQPVPILEPEEPDSEALPEPPDETLVPTHTPEDPERGRLVDPEDREPMKAARPGSWGYILL